jgi:hypothetical protein
MIEKCLSSKLVINFFDAFQLSAIFGFVSTFIFPDLQVWLNTNQSYVNIALGCIAIDHLLGTLVHSKIYKNDFDWKKNITGFGVKLSMVVVFAFLMEGLAHVTIEDDMIYRYIKMSGRILVILYPAISAMKNIKVVTNGAFPPDAIVGKLENFNKDLDIEKLKRGKDE